MRRLFWVAVGATGAVLAARRVERSLRRYTPAGIADQVHDTRAGVTDALASARSRFTVARAERERDLVQTLLVTPEDREPRATRPGRVEDEPLYDF